MDLTEQLRRSIAALSAQQQAERQRAAEFDLVELADSQDMDTIEIIGTDPETKTPLYYARLLDEESDARVETMLAADEAELEELRITLARLAGLYLKAGPSHREAALVALTQPHHMVIQSEPHEHMCEPTLVCSVCLSDISAALPDRAQSVIVEMSTCIPLDAESMIDLAAGGLVDALVARRRQTGPRGAPAEDSWAPEGSCKGHRFS